MRLFVAKVCGRPPRAALARPCPPPRALTPALLLLLLPPLQVGNDKLNAAFQEMMAEDKRTSELLDQAQEKFEVREGVGACVGAGRCVVPSLHSRGARACILRCCVLL